jgi:hypothetical protein
MITFFNMIDILVLWNKNLKMYTVEFLLLNALHVRDHIIYYNIRQLRLRPTDFCLCIQCVQCEGVYQTKTCYWFHSKKKKKNLTAREKNLVMSFREKKYWKWGKYDLFRSGILWRCICVVMRSNMTSCAAVVVLNDRNDIIPCVQYILLDISIKFMCFVTYTYAGI